jgi:hypothetical protein
VCTWHSRKQLKTDKSFELKGSVTNTLKSQKAPVFHKIHFSMHIKSDRSNSNVSSTAQTAAFKENDIDIGS